MGESRRLELSPGELEGMVENKEQRESLLNGNSIMLSTATPVTTAFVREEDVLKVYQEGIQRGLFVKLIALTIPELEEDQQEEEQGSSTRRTRTKGYGLVQPEKDVPVMQKMKEREKGEWNVGDVCEVCGVRFGYVSSKRHHCRKCGRSVCGVCSDKEVFCIEKDVIVRACGNCYGELVREEKDLVEELKERVKRSKEEREEKKKERKEEEEGEERSDEDKEENDEQYGSVDSERM